MQIKFLLPVALLSFVSIGAFGWKLHHDKQQVYELTLATGTKLVIITLSDRQLLR
ncbi:MAG: hypothetical protein HC894_23400 [Microcoleus sp. SM1_3_4]|nr:hypothetical protein [Microcoleus sp. SM1_3_4]